MVTSNVKVKVNSLSVTISLDLSEKDLEAMGDVAPAAWVKKVITESLNKSVSVSSAKLDQTCENDFKIRFKENFETNQSEALIALRRELKISQEEFASKILSLSRSTYNPVEKGQVRCDMTFELIWVSVVRYITVQAGNLEAKNNSRCLTLLEMLK